MTPNLELEQWQPRVLSQVFPSWLSKEWLRGPLCPRENSTCSQKNK